MSTMLREEHSPAVDKDNVDFRDSIFGRWQLICFRNNLVYFFFFISKMPPNVLNSRNLS